MNNIIVNSCLDYFQKIEEKDNVTNEKLFNSYFKTLKELLGNCGDNDFAKNTIISAFYSKIKSKNLKISSFIAHNEVTAFFKDYNRFNENLTNQYKDNLLKIKKEFSAIIDLDNIENQNELISYCLTESMIEYNQANINFIHKSGNKDVGYSKQFSHTFSNKKNDFEILEDLDNKPFGFYLYNLPYKGTLGNSFSTQGSLCLVSHQWNGITLFDFHSQVLGFQGLKGKTVITQNAASKKHLIDILFVNEKEKSTEISLNLSNVDPEFDSINFINKLIILGFINIATNKEERIKNENKEPLVISLNNKSTLPVIQGFKYITPPIISFDDLRFKDQYSFLSPLDDLFENVIDMNSVNYFDDSLLCHYELTMNSEAAQDGKFGNYFKKVFTPTELNKEQFNNFVIKKFRFEDAKLGTDYSQRLITPLRNSLIDTTENIYNQNYNIAKMNKLTLYNLYIEHYTGIYRKTFELEMHTFLNENIDDIMNDDEFLSLIDCAFFAKNLKSYFYKIDAENSILIYNNEYFPDSLPSINEDKEIKSLVNLPLSNSKIYDLFMSKYNLSLSKESMFFVFYQKATYQLKEIFDNLNVKNKKKQNFNALLKDGLDLELLHWQEHFTQISVLVALDKEKGKKINEMLIKHNISTKLINKDSRNFNGQTL